MGVKELKHAAKLQEWSGRIADCRSSGMSVKAWCAAQGISLKTYYYWEKRFVAHASQQLALPVSTQAGLLMRVNPNTLPSEHVDSTEPGIIIHHGESVITLPAKTCAEAVADLVRALNRHA